MEKNERQPLQAAGVEGHERRSGFLRYINVIARSWALASITVLWTAAVLTVKDDVQPLYVGWTLIGIAILVTFLELTWVIDKLVCCPRIGVCCACWSVILWVDNWKRGVVYLIIAIPLFLNGTATVLAMVSGFVLVICGCLYIVKTFREPPPERPSEVRYIQTETPVVTVVRHEMSTQTEDDRYYAELSDSPDRTNPFNEPDDG